MHSHLQISSYTEFKKTTQFAIVVKKQVSSATGLIQMTSCWPWWRAWWCLPWSSQRWRTQTAATSRTTRSCIVSSLWVCNAAVASPSGQTLLCDRYLTWEGNSKWRQKPSHLGDGWRFTDAFSSVFIQFTVLVLLLAFVLKGDDNEADKDVDHEEGDDDDEHYVEYGHPFAGIVDGPEASRVRVDGFI